MAQIFEKCFDSCTFECVLVGFDKVTCEKL